MKKLYFLGPKGTYSEQAAIKFKKVLNLNLELIPISTIAKIVDIVEKEDSFALLPIENSIEGIVRPTIDCLYESDVQIRAQLEIEINHCLYSKGLKEDIKNIISHPQALAQCQKYILENFDENINLINTASTAYAFSELKDKDKTYGAIASCFVDCDDNVKLLEKNIQDYKENKTRFILVSKNKIKIAQNTRTSIVFNTKNESGALLKILEIFKKHGLNLIYLESRPSKKVFGEYNFFADIDKGEHDIINALDEIKETCNYYKMLGSYPTV